MEAIFNQGSPTLYMGQILDAPIDGSVQLIVIIGVPNRIRTGVAAVKRGKEVCFGHRRTVTDSLTS
jgi:hypothetical protein